MFHFFVDGDAARNKNESNFTFRENRDGLARRRAPLLPPRPGLQLALRSHAPRAVRALQEGAALAVEPRREAGLVDRRGPLALVGARAHAPAVLLGPLRA